MWWAALEAMATKQEGNKVMHTNTVNTKITNHPEDQGVNNISEHALG